MIQRSFYFVCLEALLVLISIRFGCTFSALSTVGVRTPFS